MNVVFVLSLCSDICVFLSYAWGSVNASGRSPGAGSRIPARTLHHGTATFNYPSVPSQRDTDFVSPDVIIMTHVK